MRHLSAFALLVAALPAVGQTTTITFENGTLNQPPLTQPNTFQNGANFSPPGSFSSSGATFNNTYTAAFDGWTGWSYSNVVNTTAAGFGNQYAAYHLPAGGGDASANYGVGFAFAPGDATVALPADTRPTSLRLTNTTYAALSMRDGDAFAKKFGGPTGNDPDFFLLTVTGKNAGGATTGTVDFYLADYRSPNNAQDYIVSEWTTLDLTGLPADTVSMSFGFASSDVGQVGINTPTYVAADNLVVTAVPEPTLGLLAVAAAAGGWRLARRRPLSTGRAVP